MKGCPTLETAFQKFCEEEVLDGDNQYKTEKFGLQDVKKGILFQSLPPILHVHLKRFELRTSSFELIGVREPHRSDDYSDYSKVNDYQSFPTKLDLSDLLSSSADRSIPAVPTNCPRWPVVYAADLPSPWCSCTLWICHERSLLCISENFIRAPMVSL